VYVLPAKFSYNEEALENLRISDPGILDRLIDHESFRENNLKKSREKVDKRMTLKEAVARFVSDGDVVAAIMIIISPATHLEEVSTSLYLLFPPGSKGFAATLARQVDPFYLWGLVLMALGSSVISRTRFTSYVGYVAGIWLLFALGSALLTQGLL
jgi:hypothetical protein